MEGVGRRPCSDSVVKVLWKEVASDGVELLLLIPVTSGSHETRRWLGLGQRPPSRSDGSTGFPVSLFLPSRPSPLAPSFSGNPAVEGFWVGATPLLVLSTWRNPAKRGGQPLAPRPSGVQRH